MLVQVLPVPHPQPVEPAAEHADALTTIREFGRWQAANLPERDGFLYRSVCHFAVAVGVGFRPHPKPRRLKWGTPRYCYANCHRVASAGRPSRYLYAEGLCVTRDVPFPFPHAWLVDSRTGLAHELTIRDTLPTAFWGVTFAPAYSAARWREDRAGTGDCCGPLIDAWGARWPLLRMTPAELAAVTVDPTTLPGASRV